MKIYIAAQSQIEGQIVAASLKSHGHTIASRWLDRPFKRTEDHNIGQRYLIAAMDAEDIQRSDALVLISSPEPCPGGKFVELGLAMGYGKRCFILGQRENMLCYHRSVRLVETIPVLCRILS